MGITGIYKCDLVVYDGHKVVVIDVEFNSDYWLKLAADVNNFYLKFVYRQLTSGGENQNSASTCRKEVQLAVSAKTEHYPCGKCGIFLAENVIDNSEASINCECERKCGQWFHWRCVNFTPDPELESEPPWFCPKCVRNCDIVL
ncbi:hypothetical protein DPMN_053709 [Dreissena polymorpha]|uniref:PHD-type domain-containing protein n=1 Tax=Dreissena polymorpha TaxID=45954 RepID=A0A9D4HQY9_DREPO|nr:hypothetical protein DPMN_053709 [Dreissena polymorpha]